MRLVPLAALTLLAACAQMEATADLPGAAPSISEVAAATLVRRSDSRAYLCADGTVVQAEYADDDDQMGGGSALLRIDGSPVRMVRGASANGVRYLGGGLQWWTRGLTTATLTPLTPSGDDPGAVGTECRSNG